MKLIVVATIISYDSPGWHRELKLMRFWLIAAPPPCHCRSGVRVRADPILTALVSNFVLLVTSEQAETHFWCT